MRDSTEQSKTNLFNKNNLKHTLRTPKNWETEKKNVNLSLSLSRVVKGRF
jgi:hypothetical protein